MIAAKFFNHEYFLGQKAPLGGYRFYYDFSSNWVIHKRIMQDKPTSVLDLGCGRGYLLRRFRQTGVKAHGLEVSRHCYLTRVDPNITTWDITVTPWPIKDNEYDMAISCESLEWLPEESHQRVINEIQRVSKRGLHIFNQTQMHKSIESWRSILPASQHIADFAEFDSGIIDLKYNSGPVKINFGSGATMYHFGWLNIDNLEMQSFATHCGYLFWNEDIRKPTVKPTGAVTAIITEHLLDYLDIVEAEEFLNECWRILMIGGIIRIAVPDKTKLMSMGPKLMEFSEFGGKCSQASDWKEMLYYLVEDQRKSTYDENSLIALLEKVGFSKIIKSDFATSASEHIRTETYDTLPDLSVYIEARKLTL